MRNSLVGCTAVALAVHLVVPMAPPRMLPGFVDVGLRFGPDPYALAGSENANQFAAMPSMHVAWALLSGYAIWQLSTGKLSKVAGIVHPLLTSLVVIVTGHHFVSDVVIGAGVGLVALTLTTTIAARTRVEAPILRRTHSAGRFPIGRQPPAVRARAAGHRWVDECQRSCPTLTVLDHWNWPTP